jgi:hypothetical protein
MVSLPLPDMATWEICLFLAVTEEIEHDNNTIKNYYSTLEESFTVFNRIIIEQAGLFHILRDLD